MELSLNNISKKFISEEILKDVNFHINKGEKIGIVGNNGCGKTTIFKMINGNEDPTSGDIFIRKGAKIGYLDQIPEYELTVKEVLLSVFEDVIKKEDELKKIELEMTDPNADMDKLLNKYGKLQEEFGQLGGYDINYKLEKVCTGLKINEDWFNKSFDILSGGEKSRVILGKILLENPDILLLDEPSNHLDLNSIAWLEDYLRNYDGTVLIISHDRYLLDKTVNKIINIDNGVAVVYHGNYTYYVGEKKKMLEIQQSQYDNQQKKIKQMEDAIKRFRHWGSNSDNEDMFVKAKAMQKRIDRMEKIDKPQQDMKMQLKLDSVGKTGKDIILIEGLDKSFDDKVLFKDLYCHIRSGENAFLIGENGTGKSTLFKIILGTEDYEKGTIKISPSVKFGYLKQEVTYEDQNTTVLQEFMNGTGILEKQARHILAKFNFRRDNVFNQVSSLSGGEKSRLELCKLMHNTSNVLILDEPTNHLDIGSRELLEDLLKEYKGTLFVISHDRYFINKITDYILEVDNYKLNKYVGNFDYYMTKKDEIQENTKASKKPKKVKSADKKLNNNNKKIEKEIKELEDKIQKIEDNMNEELNKENVNYNIIKEYVEQKEQLEIEYLSILEKYYI